MYKGVYILSLKKIVRATLELFTYPTFDISVFDKNWKYYLYTYLALCIKFGVFIFISLGDIDL